MDRTSQRLACQQADHAAVITALRAVRERLRGQRISARADDPEALARVAFMLIDITVAVMLRERQEAGRAEDEARADAIEWLEAQVARTEIEMLESGPCSTRLRRCSGTGYPEKQTGSYHHPWLGKTADYHRPRVLRTRGISIMARWHTSRDTGDLFAGRRRVLGADRSRHGRSTWWSAAASR